MREVRHPAEKVIRNQYFYATIDHELAQKFDRAGIPSLNLVSWSGVVYGSLIMHYDSLTEEMVYRWYEPGETVKPQRLATLDEMEHLVKKYKPVAAKAGPVPNKHRNVSLATTADEDDEEL